jgi:predicted phage terminase large subunit-like protein
MSEKKRLKEWEEFVQMVVTGTLIKEDEDDRERKARKEYLEQNPEEWFKYYFPKFAYAPPAQFHKEATKRVLLNDEWCEVRLWSRELAKSTRTMMEVFYLVFVGHKGERGQRNLEGIGEYEEFQDAHSLSPSPRPNGLAGRASERVSERSPKRCVLLISNSLDNASRLLMPYKANLEYNKRLTQDYGVQQGDGTWTSAELITMGGISFRAIGVGQSPRGTRNEEARPDIILFDDVDTDLDCLNPEIVARKWRWIAEAAIGTRSVSEPTTIIFCGNRIAIDSCIQRATNIADHADEVNIRNDDGLSTWPEKNSETDIDRVLSQKSYGAQQKEYFNNPVSEGSVFKQMAYRPARPLKEYKILVCYTDPSYKSTADFKATVLVGKWESEFHVIKCFLDQATTAEMIDWHYRIMDMVGRDVSCFYLMEEVFMQDVLIKEVSDAGKRCGRPIPIRGDTRKKPDKFTRIESLLEPLNRNGELYLNMAEEHNPHMHRLVEQFCAFAPGGRAHDDGPDAVEGAIWVINEKLRLRDPTAIRTGARLLNDKRY